MEDEMLIGLSSVLMEVQAGCFHSIQHSSKAPKNAVFCTGICSKPLANARLLRVRADASEGNKPSGVSHHRRTREQLPLVVNQGGHRLRYAWDGYRLQLVACAADADSVVDAPESLQWLLNALRSIRWAISIAFLPENVKPNYARYVGWKIVHRVLSSVLQVQSTQAMLRAIGVGAVQIVPSAAALNWVLKDGLGRLGRLVYAACAGHSFDSQLKRVKLWTSFLFSISLFLEMLTPLFPRRFLILATLANIGKSISFAAYLATSSTVHKSFALADNLANISAKGQVQNVAADTLGLLISVGLSLFCKQNPKFQYTLPLVMFPVLSTFELTAIYHELQSVHLWTLNKVRLEILVESWILKGTVLSAEEVSKAECASLIAFRDSRHLPLKIGAPNIRRHRPEYLLSLLQSQTGQHYLLCCETQRFLTESRIQLYLWLHEKATSTDIITGMLHASYLRAMTKSNRSQVVVHPSTLNYAWQEFGDKTMFDGYQKLFNGSRLNTFQEINWQVLVEKSKVLARANTRSLLLDLERTGWSVGNILLSPGERCTYSTEER